ncbi:conserved hypothetical protein [Ricinus communis]|uniref:RNase H type-1 domain-containing protein n=1 Tax=Ricinus communis TaxID=3988 RepID=B9RSH6_RICCO|nr:conserved hypothetical protein [Ricinus communis]
MYLKPEECKDFLQAWTQAQATKQTRTVHQSPLPPQLKWQMPPIGHLKYNFDAATFTQTNTRRVGIVIRNERGRFL